MCRPLLALVVATLVSTGCGEGLPPDRASARGVSGSTIALADDEQLVWVTSPDDDRVVAVAAETLEVVRSIAVAGEPEQLVIVDGRLVVSLARGTALAVVDPSCEPPLVEWVPVPCGGTRGLAAVIDAQNPDESRVFATCPHDDRLVEIELNGPSLRRVYPAEGRPTAVAVAGDELVVTASREGLLRFVSLDDPSATLRTEALEPAFGVAASQLDTLFASPDGRALVAAYQRVEHDGDRERPPESGGYGAVVDGEPRLEPRLLGPCGARYARFDGRVRVFSGPSAVVLAPATETLWVAHEYTDNVAVLDCSSEPTADERVPLRAAFSLGRGPRGLAVSRDGRRAWVDVGFDAAVARLELPVEAPGGEPSDLLEAARVRRRELGSTHLSAAARRGRAVFHDAVDTHLTPSGVVTCASCHPDGGEDGLSWFLHTLEVGPKLRRTPATWNADRARSPFHWDGEFQDVGTLTRGTIENLLEGDALLVDVDAVATYLDELEPPPGRPLEAEEALAAERGRTLFESAEVGCSACHAGAPLSDGLRHAVLAPSLDDDGDLSEVVTPSLRGVRTRPPYFHDGRAPRLEDVLGVHNPDDVHGRTSHLGADDIGGLVLYLETL